MTHKAMEVHLPLPQIAVEVVDIFDNITMTIVEVSV